MGELRRKGKNKTPSILSQHLAASRRIGAVSIKKRRATSHQITELHTCRYHRTEDKILEIRTSVKRGLKEGENSMRKEAGVFVLQSAGGKHTICLSNESSPV